MKLFQCEDKLYPELEHHLWSRLQPPLQDSELAKRVSENIDDQTKVSIVGGLYHC